MIITIPIKSLESVATMLRCYGQDVIMHCCKQGAMEDRIHPFNLTINYITLLLGSGPHQILDPALLVCMMWHSTHCMDHGSIGEPNYGGNIDLSARRGLESKVLQQPCKEEEELGPSQVLSCAPSFTC